jgi:lysophospholipase L1-like esterase
MYFILSAKAARVFSVRGIFRRKQVISRISMAGVIICAGISDAFAQAPAPKQPLPKVALLGDSLCSVYAPLVARQLQGKATVITIAGESGELLTRLDGVLKETEPLVAHFGVGWDDLRPTTASGRALNEINTYADNLRQVIARLKAKTATAILFANTPALSAESAAEVERYNTKALAVMRESNVPVHDLHAVVQRSGLERAIGPDGVHPSEECVECLADAVADCLLRQISIIRFASVPPKSVGLDDATAFANAEAQRDAQVPPSFRNAHFGSFQIPQSAAAWKSQRPDVLRTVLDSLGEMPPRPLTQKVRFITRELHPDYVLERITIDNGLESEVPAIVLIPDRREPKAAAVLWLHSSTPDKNQLLTPGTNGGIEPLGEALVRRGYVVMAPDSCWYGNRGGLTPGGPMETYNRDNQSTFRLSQEGLLKYYLWMGRTLWGMMVRDDQIALDYLCSRPEVDPARIGVTGMSMGSTRSWWLAAVDERVAAAVGVACLTRYQNLIAHGELRSHGVYYFVFGLLKHFDTEGVLALIAPRPFLALTGDLDRGSPVDGIRVLEQQVGYVYDMLSAPDRFKNVVYPKTGHVYAPEMRAELLAWFERWLKPQVPAATP